MSQDDDKDQDPHWNPYGGGARLDILDPGLSPLQRRGKGGRHTASEYGPLAQSSGRLWDYLGRRQGARVGSHRKGLIATAEADPKIELHKGEIARDHEVLTEEEYEAKQNPGVVLKEPGDVPLDPEIYNLMQRITPQYFLRNVKRVTNNTDMHGSPFIVELWRDSQQYAVSVGEGQALTFEPIKLEEEGVWNIIAHDTKERKAVLNELDWSQQRGHWNDGISRMSFFKNFAFLFETTRTAGRFETDEKQQEASRAKLEAEQKRQKGAEEIARRDAERTGAETQTAPKVIPDKYKDLPEHVLKMIGLMD